MRESVGASTHRGVLSLCTSDKDHCAGNGSLSGSIEHSEERSLCPRETLLGPVFGYLVK